VITVRTIRRLPPEEQQDQALLKALKGTPWSPKGTAEVEKTLPELALEQLRFAAGKGGPLKGEEATGSQPQQGDATTTAQGGASSSGLKRTTTEGQAPPQARRRMMEKTTAPHIPPPGLRPPPGLAPPPQRPQSMEVEPTVRPQQDVELEETEERRSEEDEGTEYRPRGGTEEGEDGKEGQEG
jgi:hypothetical protein